MGVLKSSSEALSRGLQTELSWLKLRRMELFVNTLFTLKDEWAGDEDVSKVFRLICKAGEKQSWQEVRQ